MGEVFLAEHPLIGKSVALKVVHPDLAVNKEVASRFVNEAKAVSSIGNEHIVEVHDFGISPEGAHFFIMEFLKGETLTGMVKRGPIPVDLCLHVAAQIASGLAAAHAEGIIHRDLKPDNIMLIDKLGDSAFVKILDFGLAKMLEAKEQLTAMGVVLGTPEFMSPEAAESKGVDGRSDIYSLGILLFQMLTGRLPFTANSMGELMVQQVCRAPPAPRAYNPNIPPSVEQIVLRCLAKSKDDRFQSMDDLRHALLNPESYLSSSPPVVISEGAQQAVSSNHPGMARPVTPENHTMSIETPYGYGAARRGRGLILALVAIISAAGGSAAAWIQPQPAEEEASAEEEKSSPAEESASTVASPKSEESPDPAALAADAGAEGMAVGVGGDAVEDAGPSDVAAASHDAAISVAEPAEELPVVKPKVTAKVETKASRVKKKRRKPRKPKKSKVGEDTMAPAF